MLTPRSKANLALGLSTAGTFIAYPFAQHPVGGLLFAGFCAATVGGWADTFAVSALYDNPLRKLRIKMDIPWIRTDIIRKRRDVLEAGLVHMVQYDLLTEERIRQALGQLDLIELLDSYLNRSGGKEAIISLVQQLAADIVRQLEPGEMVNSIQRTLLHQARHVQVHELLADILAWSIRNGYDDKVADFLIEELRKIAHSGTFRSLVSSTIDAVLSTYSEGHWLRSIFKSLVSLGRDKMIDRVVHWLDGMLNRYQDPHSSERRTVKKWLASLENQLREDRRLQQQVENGKMKVLALIDRRVKLTDWFQSHLQTYREVAAATEKHPDLSGTPPFPWLVDVMEKLLDPKKHDAWSKIADWAEDKLLQSVPYWHGAIAGVVRNELGKYSNEQIIALVKAKAGKDLHYIRISGVMVGGLIGMALYMLYRLIAMAG
jgi:uncharacterized membrane-anchored protein YjiN (DUF445 family)